VKFISAESEVQGGRYLGVKRLAGSSEFWGAGGKYWRTCCCRMFLSVCDQCNSN